MLRGQREAYDRAGPVGRMAALAGAFDPAVARGAYADYEPALPVTSEGLISAGAGLVVGWLGVHVLAWPFRRRRRPGMAEAGFTAR